MPMPTDTPEAEEAFRCKLSQELPGFIHFLEHEWTIPQQLRKARTGVCAFHHPELLDALDETAPEYHLLEMIDDVIFDPSLKRNEWTGKSGALQSVLTDKDSGCSRRAENLLRHSNTCGTLLGILQRKHPRRFSCRKTSGHRLWTIRPPEPDCNPDDEKAKYDKVRAALAAMKK